MANKILLILVNSTCIWVVEMDDFHFRVVLNEPFDFLGQMPAFINGMPVITVKITIPIRRRPPRTFIASPRSLDKMSLVSDFYGPELIYFSGVYLANCPIISVGWARVGRATGLYGRAFFCVRSARLGSLIRAICAFSKLMYFLAFVGSPSKFVGCFFSSVLKKIYLFQALDKSVYE